mmetsp:Transcript_51904/g.77590  ORF Transcript_51904/g.77590 Transcript_51904/m.77590 type:complete len:317 (+) Transcript_51904:45-995(+)
MFLDRLATITKNKHITILQTISALRTTCRHIPNFHLRHDDDDELDPKIEIMTPTDEQCRTMLLKDAMFLHGFDTNKKKKQQLAPALVEVKTSSIPEAGRGVFVKKQIPETRTGCIPAGSVLATYGGLYIPPVPVVGSLEPYESPPQTLIPLDGDYVFCCEGGGWIQGNSDVSFLSSSSKTDGPQQQQQQLHSNNHHDVAQFANHSSQPNSSTITLFDFPSSMGVTSPPVNTPWYFCTDTNEIIKIPSGNLRLKGVVLVSLIDLYGGDEVCFDYGLNPPELRPDWYEAPDRVGGNSEYIMEIYERALMEMKEGQKYE